MEKALKNIKTVRILRVEYTVPADHYKDQDSNYAVRYEQSLMLEEVLNILNNGDVKVEQVSIDNEILDN